MTKLFQYANYIDYDELINKPLINHVVVEGDKTLSDYGIQPAGNYAHLNASGKVPFEELDDSILGNLQYQGTWDAEHNNPNLPLVPSKKGQYWIVSHGGERFELEFETGDWIIAGDGVWQKIDNTDTIISINGKKGVVVLNAEDIPYGSSNVKEALDSKQHTLTAGKNIKIENNVISAEFTEAILDYNLLYHHPSINGVELINNKTLEDLDIQKTIYAGQNVYLTKSDAQKMDDTINVYEATESRKGVSEIATQNEVNEGTDDFRYITPKKLKPIRDALEQKIAAEEARARGVEGSLSNLTTDAKNNLVSAINEVDLHSDSTSSDLADEIARATGVEGSLSNLTTDTKTNLVSAINEVDLHSDTNSTNLSNHIGNTSNPHSVTKAQIGLGNVDNTSDLDKPISTATQEALDGKVDDVKVDGTSVVTNKVANITIPVKSVNGDTGDVVIEEIKNQNTSKGMTKIWEGDQAAYDAITTKDPNTTYFVEGVDNIYEELSEAIDGKQDKILAGANITISGNVVSAIVPTKTSDLTNDSNFITNNDIINKADKSEIPTKTSQLTNDSNFITNNDIVGKADKSYVDEKLSKKQDIITGNSGEVVYHNGSNVFTQQILNEGFVCPAEEDVNICKNNSPSFSDVFNTWKKFSHLNGNDNAIASEINAWTYDSEKDTIIQPLNTSSYVGFISPKSYSSYDITVRCYSTGSDNDTIGLVAAFATDSNNKQHTLSFLRSPGGTSASWVCLLDYNNFALTSTSYGQTMIVNKSSSTTSNNSNWNTTTIGTGTVINMTRNGNILSAVCSQFNSSVLDENTRINVDLDELSATYPTLSLFKGSSPWGYSNFSQPNSMYENIAVTDPDGYIFDIPNNKVLRYDNSKKDWTTVSGQTPISSLGAGRLSYNKITGKLFYCNGSSIFQIATNN